MQHRILSSEGEKKGLIHKEAQGAHGIFYLWNGMGMNNIMVLHLCLHVVILFMDNLIWESVLEMPPAQVGCSIK